MNDEKNNDTFLGVKVKSRREACEMYARAFGGAVERLLYSADSGRVLLMFGGRELASVSFGPDQRESCAWQELSQVALALVRYERLRSR